MDSIFKICMDSLFLKVVERSGRFGCEGFVEVPPASPSDVDEVEFGDGMTVFRGQLPQGELHVYVSCDLFCVTWRPVLRCPLFETAWLPCSDFGGWLEVVLSRLGRCVFAPSYAEGVMDVCDSHSEAFTRLKGGPVTSIFIRPIPDWATDLDLGEYMVSFWFKRSSAVVCVLKHRVFTVSWPPVFGGPIFSIAWESAGPSNFSGWVENLLLNLPDVLEI